MSYTLIGSQRSPFVRISRMLMIQHGIKFDFSVLNFVDDAKAAEALEKETPINKVPILVDGAQRIYDSRVIASYLTRKHHLPELTLDQENMVSAIYGCLDTSVILFLLKRDGIDLNQPGFFLKRNRERIPRILEFVSPWARGLDSNKPQDWNYASMSLFSYLYWAQARELLTDLKPYPALQAFMTNFALAPGVKETSF
jgi:glutathione S-transferase